MSSRFEFNDEDLQFVQKLLRRFSGTYRLPELLHDVWPYIDGKTFFGISFKRAVDAGQLAGVTTCGKTVENHQLYHVAN
jgi:hypothetical protein